MRRVVMSWNWRSVVLAAGAALAMGVAHEASAQPQLPRPQVPKPPAPNPPNIPLVKPFNILVVGDSIMTGQALAPSHKLTSLVRDWLQAKLPARPVALYSVAHSGARILPGTAVEEATPAPLTSDIPGTQPFFSGPTAWVRPKTAIAPFQLDSGYDARAEIPLRFASIAQQLTALAPQVIAKQDVDLIIMDGGINDIDVARILTLDPPGSGEVLSDVKTLWDDVTNGSSTPPAGQLLARTQWVTQWTHQNGTQRMQRLLASVLADPGYANARVVFTGYYPIVSTKTPPSQVAAVFQQYTGTSIPNLGLDVIVAKLAAQSAAFTSTLDAEFAQLASASPRLTFAPIPWDDAFSYGASDTKLGRFQDTSDDLFVARGAACGANQAVLGTQGNLGPYANATIAAQACNHAQTGHPNVTGAQLFARSIENALGPSVCSLLSLPRMTVTASPSRITLNPGTCASGYGQCANVSPTAVTVTAKDASGHTLYTATQPVPLHRHDGWTSLGTDSRGKPMRERVVTWTIDPIVVDLPSYCPEAVRLTAVVPSNPPSDPPSTSGSTTTTPTGSGTSSTSSGSSGDGTKHCPPGAAKKGVCDN